jgi:hypothetical protein
MHETVDVTYFSFPAGYSVFVLNIILLGLYSVVLSQFFYWLYSPVLIIQG